MPISFSPFSFRLVLPCLVVIGLFGFRFPSHSEGFHNDLQKGSELTQEQAKLLEENLKDNPHDVSSRTQLLGYYMRIQPVYEPSVLEAKREHVLWLVKNSPEAGVLGDTAAMILGVFDPTGYSKIKEAWMTQLERNPKNVTMLGNAANFLSVTEYESAIKLLQRAQSLEPSNPKWAMQLGEKYGGYIRKCRNPSINAGSVAALST